MADILDEMTYLPEIAYGTTLAGDVHLLLTEKREVGVLSGVICKSMEGYKIIKTAVCLQMKK